jgi:subtilisin family serine protease
MSPLRRGRPGNVGLVAWLCCLLCSSAAAIVDSGAPAAGPQAGLVFLRERVRTGDSAGLVRYEYRQLRAGDDDPERATDLAVRKVPHRLILKLRPGADVCFSCRIKRGERLGAIVPGSHLDALNARFGVRSARPLVRTRGNPADPETKPVPAFRGSARQRFPQRARRAPAGAVEPDFSRTYLLDLRRRTDLDAVARAYADDPAVEYCEPDLAVEVALTPNDPYFASAGSWGQSFDDLWGTKRIAAPAAWDTTRGNGVVVAVVDTGIDYTHPDIAANVWSNAGEIAGNGIDDDGNGFVDDVRGWDFADDDNDPLDDNLHGTHVAGTIAALGNNGTGIVGVAYESRVMAVRGLDVYGGGTVSDLAEAILYAVDNGAEVINASWGGYGRSQTIADALLAAHAAGVVFVAAAGNSRSDSSLFLPGNDPESIVVSAFTHVDVRADFSNYGVKLDLAAPGGGDEPPPADRLEPIYSVLSLRSSAIVYPPASYLQLTQGGAGYLRLAGTSMAAPHVAGAAALVLAAHPDYSPEQVRQALRSTAADVAAPGFDVDSGYGMVQAAAAVAAPPPLEAHLTAPLASEYVGATTLDVRGSATGPGFASYRLDYRPMSDPNGWIPLAGPIASPVQDGLLGEWPLDAVGDGQWVLRLMVEGGGRTFVDQVPVTLRNVDLSAPPAHAALRPDAPLEIRGTAAGSGFTSYTVEVRWPARSAEWTSAGVTPAVPPGTPVRDELLATLDVSDVSRSERLDLRLTVNNAAGSAQRTRKGLALDPTLRPGWPQPLVPVGDRSYLTVADLDGDNVKEILVGSGDEVVVFEPDGSIRPGWPQSVRGSRVYASTQASPIVADVTGDAAPEVIATNRNDLFVWSADGTLLPGFPRPVDAFSALNDWLTAGDIDGDGKDEIVCTGVYSIEAYRGDGSQLPVTVYNRHFINAPVNVADVLDTLPGAEVAWFDRRFANLSGTLSLLPSTQWFTSFRLIPVFERGARGSFFSHTAMADMDGDGQVDIVLLKEPSRNHFSAHLNFRPRAYNARTGASIRLTSWRGVPRRQRREGSGILSFADLDRDGQAEAYLYASSYPGIGTTPIGYFVPYQYRRTPTRRDPLTHPGLFYDDPTAVAIGDVDGDGQQELVAGTIGERCDVPDCSAGFVRRAVFVSHLDGSTLPDFPKAVPQNVYPDDDNGGLSIGAFVDDPRFATPAIADLDGDGLKEILWVHPDFTTLFVWNVGGTPSPELADWPMYHHDPKHSNVLPVTRRD